MSHPQVPLHQEVITGGGGGGTWFITVCVCVQGDHTCSGRLKPQLNKYFFMTDHLVDIYSGHSGNLRAT